MELFWKQKTQGDEMIELAKQIHELQNQINNMEEE